MSLKRTFGLVGDYGSSSEDENDMEEEEEEKTAVKKSKQQPTEEEAQSTNENVDQVEVESEKVSEVPPHSSKWEGVRKEYEDSALMFKYIQDSEEGEKTDKDKTSEAIKKPASEVAIDAEKAAADALAAADAVLKSVAVKEDEAVKTILDDPEAKAKYYKAIYEESLKEEQAKKALEEAARDWEIKEIQREIEEERKKWDAVWSDDEGEGAESEAVCKDQKRRVNVLQAVIDEVKKANKKPEEESKVQQFTKKGEGWKRLQIIAESRVKNDPEKYITYPTHKFPLRDQ